jgi:hypothetical protein|tara:strand:+ start:168 stop:902 length:735 start_codon:yes stop_codon:yes gene_type:complete
LSDQNKIIYFEKQSTFKMNENQKHIEDLQQIRSIMERSTQFISLSGLSGISAGIFGLIGAALAYLKLAGEFSISSSNNRLYSGDVVDVMDINFFNVVRMNLAFGPTLDLVIIATGTLGLALIFATIFTARKAKKDGNNLWSPTAKKLLVNTAIPLVVGGLFCIALLKHGLFGLVAPCTLIFYGLALINGSKYTLPEIRIVGVLNIILGLLNTIYIGQGLFFWALGFGVIHIIYGVVMYFKYERK